MSKTVKLNIPEDIAGWRAIRERALTIYWDRRKNNATENQALFAVLDDCLRDDTTS
jgi:hypothetical protein